MIAPPLSYGIPAGPHPYACAHMAFLPCSAMAFAADLHGDLQDTFRRWLFAETADWARHDPPLIRLICRAVVGNHTPQGQLVEIDLMAHLANRYPLRFTPN